jgi:hypothetical protein
VYRGREVESRKKKTAECSPFWVLGQKSGAAGGLLARTCSLNSEKGQPVLVAVGRAGVGAGAGQAQAALVVYSVFLVLVFSAI